METTQTHLKTNAWLNGVQKVESEPSCDEQKVQRLEGLPTDDVVKAKSELDRNIKTLTEMVRGRLICDINGEPIDPIWAAEFRGFIWGEGSITVNRNLSIDIMVKQRSDAAETLYEFQRRLGGNIREKGYYDGTDRRVTTWQTSQPRLLLRIATLLIGGSNIPFKKKRELDLWIEAIFLKMQKQRGGRGQGFHYSPSQHTRMHDIVTEIRGMRKWTG